MRSLRIKSRRLAIETLENRLVLSGSQIDGEIWYLEPDGSQYAVISFDDFGPSATAPSQRDDRFSVEQAWETGIAGNSIVSDTPIFHGFEQHSFVDIGVPPLWKNSSLPSVKDDVLRPPFAELLGTSWFNDVSSVGLGPLLGANDLTISAVTPKPVIADSGTFDSLHDRFADSQFTLNNIKHSHGISSEFRVGLIIARPFDERIEVDFISATGASRTESHGAGSESNAETTLLASAPSTSTEIATSSKPLSEGGSIPLEAIVANVGSGDLAAEDDGVVIVDWTPKRGESNAATATADVELIGELARAVVFETIDGEPAPLVYAATESRGGHVITGEYAIAASGHLMAFPRHEHLAGHFGDSAEGIANRSASNFQGMPLSQTAAWFLAALPWTANDTEVPNDVVADSGRAEAFSRFGEADRNNDRFEGTGHSRIWLAAMPVLAVLAAERVVAAKKKREREAERTAS